MKILMVIDSFFGNTWKIGEAIKGELAKSHRVELFRGSELKRLELSGVDLLIFSSPTRAFAPTKSIKRLVKTLTKAELERVKVACFDTRMDIEKVNNRLLTFLESRFGNAASTMVELLEKSGGTLAGTAEGFIVVDSEGPLLEGELERAVSWAQGLLS